MFVREIKSDEKIKAESPELNPVPGFCEAGNLKQISKHNSYTWIIYHISLILSSGFFYKGTGNREQGAGNGEKSNEQGAMSL